MSRKISSVITNEDGVTFMATMIITLMVAVLGAAALTMSGIGSSTIGALRMAEEGTAAAESCIAAGVNVIQQTLEQGQVPLLLRTPQGPVPSTQAGNLYNEINRNPANSPDCAVASTVCPVAVPNLTMAVNNYNVVGDIDFHFRRQKPATQGAADLYYRIDCTAINAITGTQSRVIAIYDCVTGGPSGVGYCVPHTI